MYPVFVPEYQILDIFYNDSGEYVVIHNGTRPAIDVALVEADGTRTPFKMYECSEKFGRVYSLEHFLVEQGQVRLSLNGNSSIYKLNSWPSFPDEIIMSTCVKNEDDYIPQWINHHEKLGVTRFIIYDNIKNGTLTSNYTLSKGGASNLYVLLSDEMASGKVILIDWPYEGLMFQPAQENHSINAFRKSRYIGMFDVDEYLNPQGSATRIDQILPKNCESGGQLILARNFRNPFHLPEKGVEFLKIYTCDPIVYGPGNVNGSKIWVHPPNVRTMLVHDITNGLQPTRVSSDVMYFNHYKFLNKHMRGCEPTRDMDDSIKRITG